MHRELRFLLKWLVVQGLANVLFLWYFPQQTRPVALADQIPDQIVDRYTAATLAADAAIGLPQEISYRLMQPAEQTGRFPLVVFLHGAGQRGADNLQQLRSFPELMASDERRQQFPCFLVAPQCPSGAWWTDPDLMTGIMAVVEEVTRNHPAIDRRRVYLTGISMGGFGAWSLAARDPEAFAAVVPVCGRGDPEQARSLVGVPLWAVHGEADTVVAPVGSRCMIEAIRAAGGTPQYTELPGVGHSSWRQAFDDSSGVLAWMFAQSRKSPASFEGFRSR